MSTGRAALALRQQSEAERMATPQAVPARPSSLKLVRPAGRTGKSEFGMLDGFAWSVLLHAAVIFLFLAPGWFLMKPQPQRDQLVVELFGMVSNRQEQEQQAGAKTTQPPQEAAPTPPAPMPPKPVMKREPVRHVQEAPSPVTVAKPEDKPEEEPQEQVTEARQQVAPQHAGAEENRVQQTLQRQPTEADLLRMYVSSLAKAIREKLVYPQALRARGYVGTAAVRFTVTESGDLLPGSLVVMRSSGYPELDDSALRSVQASLPLPRPDRQRVVVVPVTFSGS